MKKENQRQDAVAPRFAKSWWHAPAMLALAAGIYFLVDAIVDLPPSGLVFYSETIRAIPHGDAIDFDCEFEFHATHPRQTRYPLYFPTHQEKPQAAPENVSITVDGRTVEAALASDGFAYTMPVKPKSVSLKHIRYTIRSPQHRAIYVTKTANLWPKAPDAARFVISNGMKSNYHQTSQTEVVFKDFRPKENWEVAW